mmetsp:Transcript_32508/g.51723  ORF Transcript_32508/g.51723 Transcript_32508/m.51723 type:complete len:1499 (-) Transcript_32508:128-4624(-)|eukprot:CAMPEP_0203753084 /NCGR_PEP_ID=MMETSP0098-20131031/6897_1 /ASSEMBLY_ACC=CAM_ASM_000208 /TAXON_ID=96639 /ORGANISM=" , Strain NY0313808BC1" /LENGTH=1498 /DNA_ID=CAMNT_0050643521 /DNA_START=219 /DNA_END=4715 /DNA_ORIENTATION=-
MQMGTRVKIATCVVVAMVSTVLSLPPIVSMNCRCEPVACPSESIVDPFGLLDFLKNYENPQEFTAIDCVDTKDRPLDPFSELPKEIGRFINLRVLSLPNIQTARIPEELGDLTKLEVLRLRFDSQLPHSIWHLPNIREFDFTGHRLQEPFPDKLFELTSLRRFRVSVDEFKDQPMDPRWCSLPNLTHLSLLMGLHRSNIPKEFGMGPDVVKWKLEVLNMNLVHLGDEFPYINAPNLTTFNFRIHHRSDTPKWTIPGDLSKWYPKLQILNLDLNELKGNLTHLLLSLKNSELRTLSLEHNALTGSIPVEINQLAYLETLKLNNNFLTGPLPDFDNMTNLREIYLGSNNFKEGLVPRFNYSKLEVISLENTNRIGQIPHQISCAPSLEKLNFGNNKLGGEIPHLPLNGWLEEALLQNNSLTSFKKPQEPRFSGCPLGPSPTVMLSLGMQLRVRVDANPIVCDCHITSWFIDFFAGEQAVLERADATLCSEENSYANMQITQIRPVESNPCTHPLDVELVERTSNAFKLQWFSNSSTDHGQYKFDMAILAKLQPAQRTPAPAPASAPTYAVIILPPAPAPTPAVIVLPSPTSQPVSVLPPNPTDSPIPIDPPSETTALDTKAFSPPPPVILETLCWDCSTLVLENQDFPLWLEKEKDLEAYLGKGVAFQITFAKAGGLEQTTRCCSITSSTDHSGTIKYEAQGLSPASSYQVTLRTIFIRFGWGGTSRISPGPTTKPFFIKTQDAEPSDGPTLIKVMTQLDNEVSLSWEEPSSPNGRIVSYLVQVSTSEVTGTDERVLIEETTEVTVYARFVSLRNLIPGTRYKVRISASTHVGYGPFSESFFFNTSRPCPLGTMSSHERAVSLICIPCAPGHYRGQGDQSCVKCPDMFPLTLAKGSTTQDDCTVPRGFFKDTSSYPPVARECLKGMDCNSTLVGTTYSQTPLQAGWWRQSRASRKIIKCNSIKHCLHTSSTDDYCTKHHTGVKCLACVSGYARKNPNGECEICTDTDISRETKVIIGWVAIICAICLGCALKVFLSIRQIVKLQKQKNKNCDNIPAQKKMPEGDTAPSFVPDHTQGKFSHIDDGDIVELVLEMDQSDSKRDSGEDKCNITLVKATKSEESERTGFDGTSFENKYSLRAIWGVLSTKLRLVFGFLQVFVAFHAAFIARRLETSSGLKSLFGTIELDLASLLETLQVQCAWNINHYDKMLIYTATPFLFAILFWLLYLLLCCIYRGNHGALGRAKEQTFSILFLLAFIVYPGVSRVIMATYLCDSYPMADGILVPQRVLHIDPRVSCEGPHRLEWIIYASVAIMVYPVGIVILYSYSLWKVKDIRHIHKLDRSDEERYQLKKVEFLVQPYRRRKYWFEAYELLRKVVQTTGVLLAVNLSESEEVGIFTAQIITGTVIYVLQVHRPYTFRTDYYMAVVSQLLLLTICFTLQLDDHIYYPDEEYSSNDRTVSYVVATVIALEGGAFLALGCFDLYRLFTNEEYFRQIARRRWNK